MKNKHPLPFGWAPAHWGLKGKLREVAQAEHELEGEALERELLRINLAGRTDEEIEGIKLKLDLKYGKLTEEEYERKFLTTRKSLTPKERLHEEARIDLKYGKIDENEFEKQTATINDETFVRVTRISTDPNNPAVGSFALDYNKAFVVYLEEHGYGPAPNDEEIVDRWFTELCKNIALDTFDGVGDFNEKLDASPTRKQDIIYKKDLKQKDSD
jgi:hypothetical protein